MDILGAAVKAAEVLLGRGSASHDRIASFLDSIAKDAEELARVWTEALSAFARGTDDAGLDAEFEERTQPKYPLLSMRQTYYYSKLEAFYQQFSLAIGDRVEEDYHETFIFALGTLLERRCFARAEAEKALESAATPRLLASPTEAPRLDSLLAAVEAIQREAAALNVLAKRYRASA